MASDKYYLWNAARTGDETYVDEFLLLADRDEPEIEQEGPDGSTPLVEAASLGHRNIVKALVKHGCNVNSREADTEKTSLHHTVMFGDEDLIDCLIKAGAEVNPENCNGDTPLLEAADFNHLSTAKLLVEKYKANIDAKNNNGNTSLMLASASGYIEMAKFLIDSGVNRHLKNKQGQTALKEAMKKKNASTYNVQERRMYDEIIQLLKTEDDIGNEPRRLFKWGADDTCPSWEWTKEEKKSLTDCCCMKVAFLGEMYAGKTSLVRTILQGETYLSEESNRTVIADLRFWQPKTTHRKVFSFVDLGGHDSYHLSGHYFHGNALNNLACLCHDINSSEYEKSFEWVKSLFARSPKCHLIMVLTQRDKLERSSVDTLEEMAMRKKNEFIQKFRIYIEKELELLNCTLQMCRGHRQKSMFEMVRNKYTWLRENIANITFVTSAKQLASVKKVTDYFITLSEKKENMIHLPEHYRLLGIKLLRLGVRLQGKGKTLIKSSKVMSLIKEKSNQNIHSEASTSSSVTSDTTSLNTSTAPRSHSNGVNDYGANSTAQDRKLYITFEEALQELTSICLGLGKHIDNMQEELKQCLRCLHHHGLLMYFEGNDKLANIIFNDIAVFIDILRCVFHHKLKINKILNDTNAELKAKFFDGNEMKFQQAKMDLQKGVMSVAILGVLLNMFDLDIDPEAVMNLLSIIEVGFAYYSDGEKEYHIFIPYNVQKMKPNFVTSEEESISMCDRDQLALQGCIRGNIPSTFWNNLTVRLIKHLHPRRHTQKRELWQNGLFATIGRKNMKLLVTYNGSSSIDFFTKGSVRDVEGHCLLWEYFTLIHEITNELMVQWWPGLITSQVLKCTHCQIHNQLENSKHEDDPFFFLNASDSNAPPAQEFSLEQMILANLDQCYCKNYGDAYIPAALVMPLSSDYCSENGGLAALHSYLDIAFPQENIDNGTCEDGLSYIPEREGCFKRRRERYGYDGESLPNKKQISRSYSEGTASFHIPQQQKRSSLPITTSLSLMNDSLQHLHHSTQQIRAHLQANGVELSSQLSGIQIEQEQHTHDIMSRVSSTHRGLFSQVCEMSEMMNTIHDYSAEKYDLTLEQGQMTKSQLDVLSAEQQRLGDNQQHLSNKINSTEHTLLAAFQEHGDEIMAEIQAGRQDLEENIALASRNPSLVPYTCSTHVLNIHQADLESNLQPDNELLDKMVSNELFSFDVKRQIEDDVNNAGKISRMLRIIDRLSTEETERFVRVLTECELSEQNQLLGQDMTNTMEDIMLGDTTD